MIFIRQCGHIPCSHHNYDHLCKVLLSYLCLMCAKCLPNKRSKNRTRSVLDISIDMNVER